MNIFTMLLVLLLVVGFVAIWTKLGRTLFDVAIFMILLFFLFGQVPG